MLEPAYAQVKRPLRSRPLVPANHTPGSQTPIGTRFRPLSACDFELRLALQPVPNRPAIPRGVPGPVFSASMFIWAHSPRPPSRFGSPTD